MTNLARVFSLVGMAFGTVFVMVNAGGLPSPWDVIARVVGLVLLAVAVWRLVKGEWGDVSIPGSPRAYWVAVAAEVIAIPVGASVLTRVLDQPDLVVLWVVFVVGAHFLPARAFGIGRFAELGVVLMLLAVLFAAVDLAGDVDAAPSAGAVLAGVAMLAFSAVPSAVGVRLRPSGGPATDR